VLVNSQDSVSLKRIINVPQRSIGKATVDKIESYSIERQITFENAMRESIEQKVLTGAAARKVTEFNQLMHDLRELMAKKTLSEFYHELLDHIRYVEVLKQEATEESLARIENLQEFDSILIEFEN